MAEGIDTLQSLYSRSWRSFSDGPSSTAARGSRHIARRDPEYLRSAGHENPSCPRPVDSHTSNRDNSSGRHSRRGSSRYAPPESVDDRLSPLKDVVVAGPPDPARRSDQLDVQELNRVTEQLHDILDHERTRRYKLHDIATNNYNFLVHDRSNDLPRLRSSNLRTNVRLVLFVTSWMQLVGHRSSVRAGRFASPPDWLVETGPLEGGLALDRGGVIRILKRARTDITGGDVQRKTQDVYASYGQFNRVCVAHSAQHTKWTDVPGQFYCCPCLSLRVSRICKRVLNEADNRFVSQQKSLC
uniref:Uncharacterized protein n=1 Tax=Peronospora matthiolae TaxID=2874970 RepID=A0AAV1UB99_9STRA